VTIVDLLYQHYVATLKERNHLEDLGVGGRTILKTDPEEIKCESVHWIQLAQDRLQWRVLVNTVMNIMVP
jgi:hypothetical protein